MRPHGLYNQKGVFCGLKILILFMLAALQTTAFRGRFAVRTPVLLALSACLWSAVSLCAPAQEFTVELQASSRSQRQTARSSQAAGARPVLPAGAGEAIRVQWFASNAEKGPAISDVTLHVFLEKENAIGQAAVPKPSAQAPYESALVMDFEPGARSTGDFSLQAPEAGNYLLRVETIGASKKLGREYFAAMDVKIQ